MADMISVMRSAVRCVGDRGGPVKEPQLREKLLLVLPTLQWPTFKVIQAQFNDRLKRGVLDRTLRHMVQDGVAERVTVDSEGGRTKRYRLTQEGLTERARLMLAQRTKAS
jgi:hypothetical protein